jgi:hypothetical protein
MPTITIVRCALAELQNSAAASMASSDPFDKPTLITVFISMISSKSLEY